MGAILTKLRNYRPSSHRGKRTAVSAIFLLIAALASLSIFATGPDSEPEIRTEKAWPVSVLKIRPATLQPSFTAYGRIESSNVAHLRTDVSAEVSAVHVKEGDWARKGQTLITLNDRELQLRLLERRAELAQLEASLKSIRIESQLMEESTSHYQSMQQVAQNKLKRHQDLVARRLISQELLDEITAQASQVHIQYQTHMRSLADFPNRLAGIDAAIARARALVQQAELDIEKTQILAPFSGPILGVFVAPGDRSNLGAVLADIADATNFEVRVQVPERYGSRLHANLLHTRSITARTAHGLSLRLSRLSSQVKQGQSGLDAFFELEVHSGTPATAMGRLLELSITLPEENDVVALPVQSIYENDRIYAVKDNRLESITIERVGETHTSDGQYRVLVRSPELSAGQAIITTQLPKAIGGLLVEPA